MSILTWITEKELTREINKKQRGPISLEEKHENFIAAVRKWEMLVATKGGNDRQWKKKVNRNTCINISSIKRVIRKFPEVSRRSRGKQRQKNVQKSVLHVQSFFLAN